jgi:hypothetical protein
MNAKSKNSTIKAAALVLVLVIVLLGGLGTTAAAAQNSLPGDALYSVKTKIEDTRLSLARDARDRAEMQMSFAEHRLTEISDLVEQGRFSEINVAILDFETQINNAIVELQIISQSDPAGAAVLAADITTALSRYAQTLSSLAARAPESVQSELVRALDSTEIAGGLGTQSQEIEITGAVEAIRQGEWVIGGRVVAVLGETEINGSIQVGDFVKAHVRVGADQSLTAREIEPATAQAGENENTNDDSLNQNTNEMGDDNSNLNMNDALNTNGMDDSNANQNTNSDDSAANSNTNANTNDDSAMNSNSNANTNDDSGGNSNGSDDSGGGSGKGGDDNP